MNKRYRACGYGIGLAVALLAGCAGPKVAQTEKQPTSRPVVARPSQAPIIAANTIIRRDVAYVAGGAEKQKMDLYLPAGAANAPVVIYVHGGEWTKGDKTELSYKPRFCNENGIILASINYRLSGTDKHPAQVEDVAAAIRWLRDHAGEMGGDPQQIFLLGHSAGCHLVTLVGLDPRPLGKVGMKPADLKGVISWSGGAFDLEKKVADGGMYATYIRMNFGLEAACWRDASPANHVGDVREKPRFLFASAGDGNASSKVAAEQLAARIGAAGGDARCVTLAGKDHFYSDHDLGGPGDKTGAILLEFVRGQK